MKNVLIWDWTLISLTYFKSFEVHEESAYKHVAKESLSTFYAVLFLCYTCYIYN